MAISGDRANSSRVTTSTSSKHATAVPVVYLGLSLLILVALAVALDRRHGIAIVDDAYIALIYARNLANGLGLVYADGVRVEGYTDFLWVVAGAISIRAGIDPVRFLEALSLASAVALVIVTWRWSRSESLASETFRIAPLVLAASGPLAFWALAGMEVVTFSLLLVVGVIWTARARTSRGALGAGLVYAAAAMTHPDGALWFLVAAGFYLFRTGRLIVSRQFLALTGGFALFALYWILRWTYFGDPMPNTFYAKSAVSMNTLDQGARYVLSFLAVWGVLNVALIAAAVPIGLLSRPITRLFFVNTLVWMAYLVWIGGDGLLAHRFIVPILAPLAILLQESLAILVALANVPVAKRAVAGSILAVLFVAGSAASWSVSAAGIIRIDGELDASRVAVGEWLGEHTAPNTLIAVNAAGAIPFYAERPVIDMVGLNDRHIARQGLVILGPAGHRRHDPAYVLRRQPSFVVLNGAVENGQRLNADRMGLPSSWALVAMPVFRAEYTRVRLTGLATHEIVFIRSDELAGFESRKLVERVVDSR